MTNRDHRTTPQKALQDVIASPVQALGEVLLPCPFCGGEPYEHAIEPHTHSPFLKNLGIPDHGGSNVIECGCGAGLIDDTREAVVIRWNQRQHGQHFAGLELDNAHLKLAVREQQTRAETAESELARCRADAERYRWLRDKHNDRESDICVMYEHGLIEDITLMDPECLDLDAAIDAAMRQDQGAQEDK